MNTYICLHCGHINYQQCAACTSGRLQAVGDIHLGANFVDAYVDVQTIAGQPTLIIKKPSGQVNIPLTTQDLLPGF